MMRDLISFNSLYYKLTIKTNAPIVKYPFKGELVKFSKNIHNSKTYIVYEYIPSENGSYILTSCNKTLTPLIGAYTFLESIKATDVSRNHINILLMAEYALVKEIDKTAKTCTYVSYYQGEEVTYNTKNELEQLCIINSDGSTETDLFIQWINSIKKK